MIKIRLIIKYPNNYKQERLYIYNVIFKEVLGIAIAFEPSENEYLIIVDELGSTSELVVNDSFFQCAKDLWLTKERLPETPLDICELRNTHFIDCCIENTVPVIYGERLNNNSFFEFEDNKITIGIDIFGSAFFMLTRYEEIVSNERDEHDRFPISASLAWKENFLMRPIIDEYVEIIWTVINKLWPELKRKQHDYNVYISHDVDMPSATKGIPLKTIIKQIAGDIVKRKELDIALKRFCSLFFSKMGMEKYDMYSTFDFIMNSSEEHKLTSTFYFITDHSAGAIDGFYYMNEPHIERLLQQIADRGHKVGLHPSYMTYKDQEQLKKESTILKERLNALTIKQSEIGSRMHFLRWSNPETWRGLENANLVYDSTLGFAEHIGFRAGTCREYSTYDLLQRKPLHLKERPLLIMDQTLLNKKYMNLSIDEALRNCKMISDICRKYKGNFTLLWHNSFLVSKKHKELYATIVKSSKGGEDSSKS